MRSLPAATAGGVHAVVAAFSLIPSAADRTDWEEACASFGTQGAGGAEAPVATGGSAGRNSKGGSNRRGGYSGARGRRGLLARPERHRRRRNDELGCHPLDGDVPWDTRKSCAISPCTRLQLAKGRGHQLLVSGAKREVVAERYDGRKHSERAVHRRAAHGVPIHAAASAALASWRHGF